MQSVATMSASDANECCCLIDHSLAAPSGATNPFERRNKSQEGNGGAPGAAISQ